MSRKPGFVSTLMVVLVVTLVSGFHAYSVKADGWVHYVPGEDQVSFEYSKFNGTSYVNISLYFGSSDYNVSDWGTPTIVGTNISVDAEIWMWTGISFPLDMRLSHQYNLGNLTSGQYVFSFRVWTYPVKDNTFNVPIIVPEDYLTIQEAINNANEGDTIFVRNGLYYENLLVNRSVSLVGEGRENVIIDGRGINVAVNVTASYVSISKFTVQNSDGGIVISNSERNLIHEVAVDSSTHGIYVDSSDDNVIEDSIIENAYAASGICIFTSHKNIVRNSIVRNNRVGIHVEFSSSGNLVENCTISYNTWGAVIAAAADINYVIGNSLFSNEIGMTLEHNRLENIYHNNFIDNVNQVEVRGSTENLWDDGYPFGGNYWNDYNGTDLFLGPFQNETGSDGMGDTPYVIDENNTDLYPLMSPWIPPDVAVLNMTSSKTIVGQGYSVNLNTTMQNQGSKIEELNATFYANETLIEYQTFLLRSGDSILYTHNWNSAGLAKGNYTLSIHIDPSEGETDLTDNSLCDGWLLVTIPGDLSGDFTVNILDAILLAGCFSSVPGSHHWDPSTDINSDNVVDIYDALILAGHYNQHYP